MEGPMVRQVERRARRFNEMIKALNLDEIELIRQEHGEAYMAARSKCLNCVCPGECLAWVGSQGEKSEAPWYCPNRELFAKCKG